MLYEKLAGLRLEVTGFNLQGLNSKTSGGWVRHSTVVHLSGDGQRGSGEDITYAAEDQLAFQSQGPKLKLCGSYTIESFSRHLDSLELFVDPPSDPANPLYRRWAFESAALDLALRQCGKSLCEVLDRSPKPVNYVVSLGLGSPPSDAALRRVHAQYPGTGFKVDLSESWTDATIDLLKRVGTVTTVDFKGQYHGKFKGAPPSAEMYRAVAERMPEVWLEDPAQPDPAWDALEPYRSRITWDAILHSVADIVQLPVPPKCVNIKPSRFGFLSELMRVYEYCESQGIAMYGGGQFELGVGRDQIQYLASLFHPEGENDVAPGGFNLEDLPGDLPPTPLQPSIRESGFAWSES